MAESLLVKADKIASDAPEIKLELARCKLYRNNFVDCRRLALEVAERASNSERQRTIGYDLALQSAYRAADVLLEKQEVQQSITYMEEFIELYRSIPAEFLDSKMEIHLSKMLQVPSRAFRHQADLSSRERLDALIEALEVLDPAVSVFEVKYGTIKTVKWDRGFGFISVPDERDVYFQDRDLIDRSDWDDLREGQQVRFRIHPNGQQAPAKMIRVVRDR